MPTYLPSQHVTNPSTRVTGTGFLGVAKHKPLPVPMGTRTCNPHGFTNPSYSLQTTEIDGHVSNQRDSRCKGIYVDAKAQTTEMDGHVSNQRDLRRIRVSRPLVSLVFFLCVCFTNNYYLQIYVHYHHHSTRNVYFTLPHRFQVESRWNTTKISL
jgi:hypothetical protein